MYCINEKQIDYILNDIRARGVEMEDLQLNLLDHVCCIIEQDLREDGNFEEFYQKTISRFFKHALWEIEEETITLLTFKHYYTMKKVMIYSGAFSAFGIITGSVFKIMHWPGAAVLLLLAAISISFVFLPLLFIIKMREEGSKRDKLIMGIGTVFGILFCTSTFFKIMYWPGANIMWLMALGILLLLFVPVYFFTGIRSPETKVNTIITTIIIIGAGGMLFTLTSLRSSKRVQINKTYNYLQSEELVSRLKSLKTDTGKQDAELLKIAASIETVCNRLEKMIIHDEIGKENIPFDFENTGDWIEESGLGDQFKAGGEGFQVFQDLRINISKYNALCDDRKKIPLTLEKTMESNIIQQSNFNLLFHLSQIELFLALNEK